jgi:hypothetical protein
MRLGERKGKEGMERGERRTCRGTGCDIVEECVDGHDVVEPVVDAGLDLGLGILTGFKDEGGCGDTCCCECSEEGGGELHFVVDVVDWVKYL